jgi:hypothetical protein
LRIDRVEDVDGVEDVEDPGDAEVVELLEFELRIDGTVLEFWFIAAAAERISSALWAWLTVGLIASTQAESISG